MEFSVWQQNNQIACSKTTRYILSVNNLQKHKALFFLKDDLNT